MSTQPINAVAGQRSISVAVAVRWDSRIWEKNLTFSFAFGGYYTLLKVIGVMVILGGLGLLYRAYKAIAIGEKTSQRTHQTTLKEVSKIPSETEQETIENSSVLTPSSPVTHQQKKSLPNGIKEENIKACLDYIKSVPWHGGAVTTDEGIFSDMSAFIPGDQVAEFAKGVDGWNYNTFFDYLVKEGRIKKYHICCRNNHTLIWV